MHERVDISRLLYIETKQGAMARGESVWGRVKGRAKLSNERHFRRKEEKCNSSPQLENAYTLQSISMALRRRHTREGRETLLSFRRNSADIRFVVLQVSDMCLTAIVLQYVVTFIVCF